MNGPRPGAGSTWQSLARGAGSIEVDFLNGEIALLGRSIDARTALTWALVNAVVLPSDIEEESLDWAEELAANAPLSVRGNKRVIRELLRAGAGLDPDIERELIELRRACFASEDMREGVRAFAEKRPARWRGK